MPLISVCDDGLDLELHKLFEAADVKSCSAMTNERRLFRDHFLPAFLIAHAIVSIHWWYSALLPTKTVGVMGDARTYEYTCLLRAVTSEDGMTADYYNFPKYFFDKISNKIINNVKGINRVVYDISSKPPSTIELE